MKKGDRRQWLTERGSAWEEQWLRARLLAEVEREREETYGRDMGGSPRASGAFSPGASSGMNSH